MNYSQLANKLRNKITKFSGILSEKLDKSAQRFIQEAIYGIMASQSVMLTEIGRQLETNVSLKKIEERFSRQLIKSKIKDCLQNSILSLANDRIKEDTLLILDLSDIKKKYAEKMEYLAQVRDGSDHGEIVDGYWTNQVIASEIDSNEITPLYHSVYSQKSPEFISENIEIINTINQVGSAIDNKGIWVIDRGGDREALYESFIINKRNFIIRLVGSRNLLYKGKIVRSLWLAYACQLPYKQSVIKFNNGKEMQYNLRFGAFPVRLPGFKTSLTMVVIKGFSEKPMMLLTTLQVNASKKQIWFIIKAYLKRWGIEETIRFVKQTYDLENIRVLKYTRLQNIVCVLLAVFFFISVILDQNQKLIIMTGHILKSAKRVFGIPDFKYYALGDGISNIFSRYPGKLLKHTKTVDLQLSIGFG
ncbi:transposase [Bacteroidota bacterium]